MPSEIGAKPRYIPDLVLACVTIVWGSSFVVVKDVLQTAPPLAFLFFRFSLGGLLLLPALFRRAQSKGLWRDGIKLGILLALGMGSQVLGQIDTSASKAAFITGLSVPLTPLVGVLRTRRLPNLENLIGVSLATVGFLLLTFPADGGSFNRGDLMIALCAVAFALYIVDMSIHSARHNTSALTAIQIWVVALLAGVTSLVFRSLSIHPRMVAFEARPVEWNGSLLFGVIYLGSIGTVGTFFGQAWAQKFMSATHVAVLFSLEPVVAAILAAWLLKERLGLRGTVGALLALMGVLVSELRISKSESVPP